MNEKVDIEVYRRKLTVEMEGMTPIEINAIAQQVNEKMEQIANGPMRVVDSSKLAIYAALEFAAELARMKEAADTHRRVLEHKVDEMTVALSSALASTAK